MTRNLNSSAAPHFSCLVWGTYWHGIFDADEFRRWFIDRLRVHRGLPARAAVMSGYDLEAALDKPADIVRAGLDLDYIYRLIWLG
ncbi:MAG: hypothetical protein HQK60_14430 [Deltaproteobacteria bacterium]|nr:hypothetical protein [Deltaproteobacteria bacterium]